MALKDRVKYLAIEHGWKVYETGHETQRKTGFPELLSKADFIICAYFASDASYDFKSLLDRSWAEALDQAYAFAPGCKVLLLNEQYWEVIESMITKGKHVSAARQQGFTRVLGEDWLAKIEEK